MSYNDVINNDNEVIYMLGDCLDTLYFTFCRPYLKQDLTREETRLARDAFREGIIFSLSLLLELHEAP